MQGGTTAWCHTFNKNLGIGSIGAEINALHSVLSKEVVTSDFGWSGDNFDEQTASYVVELQEKYASEILKPLGLKHGTGYLGNSTRAKLNKLYGCGAQPLPPCQTIAKQCPDGSYVNRSGPNCEFTACSTSCVGEGEAVGNLYPCCTGLIPIINESAPCPVGAYCKTSFNICAYCGNGVCGAGENVYNCPSDCKKTENLPPVVDGITAPTQLKVNEQGTWVIKAHDPENGYLNYIVDWGDTGSAGWWMPNAKNENTQTNTLQHSFSKAGTYTVTFTITDDKSKSVKTSTTVKVAGDVTACTDSDGGKSYYTTGRVYESGKNYTDYCIDNYKLMEYFCLPYSPLGLGGPAEDVYSCPNGCSNGACNASSTQQKAISVISPNNGETYKTGDIVNIRWNSSNISYADTVQIKLLYKHNDPTYGAGQYFEDGIIYNIANTGSYAWKIPEYYANGVLTSSFSVKVSVAGISGYSYGKFNIIPGVTKNEINVSSPLWGVEYYKGNVVPITWLSPSNGTDQYSATLLRKNDPSFLRLSLNTTGYSSNLSWKVPTDIPDANDYFIKINEGSRTKTGYSGIFSVKSTLATTTPVACTDSDGGKDYFTKGVTMWGPIGGVMYNATDTCDLAGSTLSEAYCSGNYSTMAYYTCPNGCSNGTCISKDLSAIDTWINYLRTSPLRKVVARDDTYGTVNPVLWVEAKNALNYSLTIKEVNDRLLAVVPYSVFGWAKMSSPYLINDPLFKKQELSSLEPGVVYGVREIVDCQKKYGTGYFCAQVSDLATKCSGSGDLKQINDLNIYAFCNTGGRYCLKCNAAVVNKLSVSKNQAVPDSTAYYPNGVPGTNSVLVASFIVKNDSSEDMDINSFDVTDSNLANAGFDSIQGLKAYSGALSTGVQQGYTQGSLTKGLTYSIYLPAYLPLKVGNYITLNFYADIKTGAMPTLQAGYPGFIKLAKIHAVTRLTHTDISWTTGQEGQKIYINESGNLSVRLDSSSPFSKNLLFGSKDNELARFVFEASYGEDINIREIKFSGIVSTVSLASLVNISLWTTDGTRIALLPALDMYGNAQFNLVSNYFIVPSGTKKVLIVKADINNVGELIQPNTIVKVNLNFGDVRYRGVVSSGLDKIAPDVIISAFPLALELKKD